MQIPNTIAQTFKVDYTYNLYFTNFLFDKGNAILNDILKNYIKNGGVKILFVIDDGVLKAHPDIENQVKNYCVHYAVQIEYRDVLIVPGGEQAKNSSKILDSVLQAINDSKICRHSFVAAIGGGAVIDMVGYACAIAHRGVKLLRIPTTVLSQNDSAVGVKNSINFLGKKNFLGTFAPPYAIINDFNFLTTLEQRDWVSGIAEAIKVALIKDSSFYFEIQKSAALLRSRDMASMEYLIYRCAELHMEHIAQGGDPFETGSSRPLDFGHWAAHKMEHMTNYSIRHGEAVAIGMGIDLAYAEMIGLISNETLQLVLELMRKVGFDLKLPIKADEMDELLNGIQEFREHLGGELTITLISEIGKKHDVHQIDMGKMREAISLFL
tara:strand:+ start:11515 stop:12657 length:1143 start_codon:yes stop_codon:yes gene_type:complete